MCGLVAVFSGPSGINDSVRQDFKRAVDWMDRRGPDGLGQYDADGILLGHRRLAILDLDPRAGQPMQSPCGRYVIVFNGEIYNFRALRRGLEAKGVLFSTTSDTEVLLALFALEGEAMLPRLQGMFAFAIWDRLTKKAFAARDPYGIKPLYVAVSTKGIWLASQVKALRATQAISRAPDARGQAGFWMLGSVPEPHTWYRDISSVGAGHCLWIEAGKVTSSRCWRNIGAAWHSKPERLPMLETRARVRAALKETIARHLVSDVPVGVFLAGGIDSGALAGLMVEAGVRDLQGITISYDEYTGSHEDEAPMAAQLADHYGIQHHVRRVTQAEFLADLPKILNAMDQPSIDGVNTWYASKATAERGLKVVVSGVGGDELFLGYESFRSLPRLVSAWSTLSPIPGLMGLAIQAARFQARRTDNRRWGHAPNWAKTIGGAWWLRRSLFAPEELPSLMGAELAAEALRDFDAEQWVTSMTGSLPPDRTVALAQVESMTYLRNQLLRDSDWASMDHGVELRTPLVDSCLLETIGAMTSEFPRYSHKRLLADAPQRQVPRAIVFRKKTGFGIPSQEWLARRRPDEHWDGMKSWARELVGAYETAS